MTVDELINHYLRHLPDAFGRFQTDPHFNTRVHDMRTSLVVVDEAMTELGIDPGQREQVLRRVIDKCLNVRVIDQLRVQSVGPVRDPIWP